MTIDWNEPLTCEHGEIAHVIRAPTPSDARGAFYWVVKKSDIDALQGASWTVREDGTPIDSWMPRVYNAKRKPKEGETWMFECSPIGGASRLKAIHLSEGVSVGRVCKPLYPLIKDPDF